MSFFLCSVSVNIYNTGDAPATQRTVRDFSGTFFATGCKERSEKEGISEYMKGVCGWERKGALTKVAWNSRKAIGERKRESKLASGTIRIKYM